MATNPIDMAARRTRYHLTEDVACAAEGFLTCLSRERLALLGEQFPEVASLQKAVEAYRAYFAAPEFTVPVAPIEEAVKAAAEGPRTALRSPGQSHGTKAKFEQWTPEAIAARNGYTPTEVHQAQLRAQAEAEEEAKRRDEWEAREPDPMDLGKDESDMPRGQP